MPNTQTQGKLYNFQGDLLIPTKHYSQTDIQAVAAEWFKQANTIFLNGVKLSLVMPVAVDAEQLKLLWKDFLLSKFSKEKPIPIFTPEKENQFLDLFAKTLHQGAVMSALEARLKELGLKKNPTAEFEFEREIHFDTKQEKIMVTETVKFSKISLVESGRLQAIAVGKYLLEGTAVHSFALDKDNHCKCELVTTTVLVNNDKAFDLFLSDTMKKMNTATSLIKVYQEYKKQLEKDTTVNNDAAIMSVGHLIHILESKADSIDENLGFFRAKLLKETYSLETEGSRDAFFTSTKASVSGKKLVSETWKLLDGVGLGKKFSPEELSHERQRLGLR